MNIAIIILTWNGLEMTKRCLESLLIDSLDPQIQVIVVDNGSIDGTVPYLESLSRITLIKNHQNLGYSKSVNIGIAKADPFADIVLLNNDVELVDPNWLNNLYKQSKTFPDQGIIGVKILQDNGLLQHCGAFLPLDTYWGQQVASGEQDIGQYSGISECESVVFACVYITNLALKAIGLLDEQFFAYFEDTDYCLRAKKLGFKVVLNGDVRILHSENSSTKINKVSHKDIFLTSQKLFKNKWCKYLNTHRYSKGRLDFHSILNFPSGYASSARAFIETLDQQGFELAYRYVYGPGTVFPIKEPAHSDSYICNLVSNRPFGQANTQIVYAQGDVFERNTGKVKIGFTMLEVNGLPAEWSRQANLMDEVWVPSRFNKETFEASGVIRPIHVIPLGVNPHYFSPSITGWKPDHIYTFLSVFEWGERKAPELLIQAFSDEFNRNEDVVLICKINNFDSSVHIAENVNKMGLRSHGGKIIFAENRILERYELGSLYRSADCFVLPTRGEGWGMPILEAMACGLPVIATNWSSQTDFMNTNNSLPLAVEKLIPAIAKCPYYEGFQWAQPSYEHLRHLMRWVYENREAAKVLGDQAAKDARQSWSWHQAADHIRERLTELN